MEDLTIENLEILNSKDSLIVSVTHAKIKEEPVLAAEEIGEAEEGAEPEVISKGKADESEETEEKEAKEKKEK